MRLLSWDEGVDGRWRDQAAPEAKDGLLPGWRTQKGRGLCGYDHCYTGLDVYFQGGMRGFGLSSSSYGILGWLSYLEVIWIVRKENGLFIWLHRRLKQ